MKRKKRKFRKIKSRFKYIISSLLLLITSCIISYGKIEGFNWHNIFKNLGTSDYVPDVSSDFNMNVHFLDVGKADCAYIKCKDCHILIDAADKEPSAKVVEYLKRQGVSKLDLAIVSHPHRDHIGQMPEVINEFEIKKFIEPDVPEKLIPVGKTYERMLKALKDKAVTLKRTRGRESMKLGDLKLDFFGPLSVDDNINNNSVVLKITYGDVSFLFVGDAEKPEENEILERGYDLKSTVLKVGHHGSRTSSGESFLRSVYPECAVISVGPDRNNLPKEEVVKRISKFCKNIYRTDLSGNIVISTNGKEIKVRTEKK